MDISNITVANSPLIVFKCVSNTFGYIDRIKECLHHFTIIPSKQRKNKNFAGIVYVQYETLKKAIQSGDWIAAEEFLKRQPDAVAAKITNFGETALFVAVYTGHEHIVEKLVDLMSDEDLAIPNNAGNTALVQVISVGNYRMAACMLRKNNNLIRTRDSNAIPVNQAMGVGHIELARYLYSLTPLGDLMLESGIDGSTLCVQAIYNQSLGKNPTLRLKV
jgi:hypothetical protein